MIEMEAWVILTPNLLEAQLARTLWTGEAYSGYYYYGIQEGKQRYFTDFFFSQK